MRMLDIDVVLVAFIEQFRIHHDVACDCVHRCDVVPCIAFYVSFNTAYARMDDSEFV